MRGTLRSMRTAVTGVGAATLLAAGTGILSPAPARGHDPRALPRPAGVLPVRPISDINADLGNGYAQLEFNTVHIQGVVQTAPGNFDPWDGADPSTWFYVSDGTGGVAVVERNAVDVSVSPGDRVDIEALVITRGLVPVRWTRSLDLNIATAYVTVIGSGPLDAPVDITAGSLLTAGHTVEGSRVKIAGVTIVDLDEWPDPGQSAFVRVTDGVDEIRLRVDEDTDLDEAVPPAAAFDLTGFVAQDGSSAGPGTHYVLPAGVADLAAGDGSGLVTVTPARILQGETGVTLQFTITGQEATLETIEIDIPEAWNWTSPGDAGVTGAGFASAAVDYRLAGSQFVVEVTGAAVTAGEPGVVEIRSLTAPTAVGNSAFLVRTATSGGAPTQIPSSPVVRVIVDADPGEVLVNEIYAHTVLTEGSVEHGEFIELRNVSGGPLELAGWTLSDMGRVRGCFLGSRWAFPDSTIVPDGGYVVVCRTANNRAPSPKGFLIDFPDFRVDAPGALLFETFDGSAENPSENDPTTRDMVLLDPTSGNDQIALLGGPTTNVGQCESPSLPGVYYPFSELVVLQDVTGQVIDALEYREGGPCPADYCDDGITGGADAYRWGPPKYRQTLGRDAASTDDGTPGGSVNEIFRQIRPTPGLTNVVGDDEPPLVTAAALSGGLIEITFDESVDEASATDTGNYSVTVPSTGRDIEVLEVLVDPEVYLRHFYLATDQMPAGETLLLTVSGVTDIVAGGVGGNPTSAGLPLEIPPFATTICAVQEYDAAGFSPAEGDTVTISGFVTAGSVGDRLSIWVQEPGGCGVNVFSFDVPGDVVDYGIYLNDLVQIQGRVTEFVSSTSGNGAVTEIEAVEGVEPFYRFLLRGLDGPEPIEVTTFEANDEALEGTLVHTKGTAINANSLAVWIDDGSGAIQIFQNFSSLDISRFKVGDPIEVTGIITQFDATEPYLSGYELVPQSQESVGLYEAGFAPDSPILNVARRILVPELGETITIASISPERSDVVVEIYDSIGRKITTLYDGIGLGRLVFEWNGTGRNGLVVEPGMYVCHARSVSLDGGDVKTASAPIIVGLRLNGSEAPR